MLPSAVGTYPPVSDPMASSGIPPSIGWTNPGLLKSESESESPFIMQPIEAGFQSQSSAELGAAAAIPNIDSTASAGLRAQ